jgi:hypothetical protein
MSDSKVIPLTASELGYLWTGCSINQMSKWYLTVFVEHSNDADVKDLFRFALQVTNEMIIGRKKILGSAGCPIPLDFCERDISISSPPLFSEKFMLYYMHKAARVGLEFHSRALALAARIDIRKYQEECLQSAIQLNERVVDLLLTKGIYSRTPHLPTPTVKEDIQKSSYLNGWFGDTRTMNSMEIANLYSIVDLLVMMETLTGFAQTTDSEEVVELLQKGVTVVQKQLQLLNEFLAKDELPIRPSYLAELTDSNKRVFSDKIMVCHVAGLFGSLLSQYGFSLGSVMKHDLLAAYSTQIAKAGSFSEKVTRFLIEKEWLEQVPGATLNGSH